MSQENVEVVRKPLRVREQSSRTLDQRLSLRFPLLAAANARPDRQTATQFACPPGGTVPSRAARGGGVQPPRSLDAVVIGAHPEFEYHPERNWVEAGLVEPCYRGLEGYRRYVATVDEVWGGENYLKPVELIDLGERFVMLADGTMRAQASGVPLTEAYAAVSTLKDGRVIHLQEYCDHDEALDAVGLSEQDASS